MTRLEAKHKIEDALAATQDIEAVHALDWLVEQLDTYEAEASHFRRGYEFQLERANGLMRRLRVAGVKV